MSTSSGTTRSGSRCSCVGRRAAGGVGRVDGSARWSPSQYLWWSGHRRPSRAADGLYRSRRARDRAAQRCVTPRWQRMMPRPRLGHDAEPAAVAQAAAERCGLYHRRWRTHCSDRRGQRPRLGQPRSRNRQHRKAVLNRDSPTAPAHRRRHQTRTKCLLALPVRSARRSSADAVRQRPGDRPVCRGHVLLRVFPVSAKTAAGADPRQRCSSTSSDCSSLRTCARPRHRSLVYDAAQRIRVPLGRCSPICCWRRDQPDAAQDAGRPSRPWRNVRSASRANRGCYPTRSLSRDSESYRVRGHLPVPEAQLDRFPAEAQCASSATRSGDRDPGPPPAASTPRPVRGETRCGRGRTDRRPRGSSTRCWSPTTVLGYIVDIAGRRGAAVVAAGCVAARPTALLATARSWAGCPAATTSRPTTSRQCPSDACDIGWRFGRRPSWRAPTPMACSTAYWRPCRCRASDSDRPRRLDCADLRSALAISPWPQSHSSCCWRRWWRWSSWTWRWRPARAGSVQPAGETARGWANPSTRCWWSKNRKGTRFRGQIRDAWAPSARAEPRTHPSIFGNSGPTGSSRHTVAAGPPRRSALRARHARSVARWVCRSAELASVPWQIRILPRSCHGSICRRGWRSCANSKA